MRLLTNLKQLYVRDADWLRAQQRDDGGFAGREGESDPYYTAFALRGLWILEALDETVGRRAADFLRGRLSHKESIIDLISLIFAAAICELAVGAVVIEDDDATWRENVAAHVKLNGLDCQWGSYSDGAVSVRNLTLLNAKPSSFNRFLALSHPELPQL